MIAKIAVAAAIYAIDKPYDYRVPEGMLLRSGQRVSVPFGRSNKRSEGVVLALTEGDESKLKGMEDLFRAYGIKEITRTGKIAMSRNSKEV